MFEKNSFIKWSSSDEAGSFFIVGEVMAVEDDVVTFADEEGMVYGVPVDDSRFTSIKKPKNWRGKVISVESIKPTTTPAKPKAKRTRSTNGSTKLEQVVALLRADSTLVNNRKMAIDKIVEQIGMTSAGASTYFSNAKKQLT